MLVNESMQSQSVRCSRELEEGLLLRKTHADCFNEEGVCVVTSSMVRSTEIQKHLHIACSSFAGRQGRHYNVAYVAHSCRSRVPLIRHIKSNQIEPLCKFQGSKME